MPPTTPNATALDVLWWNVNDFYHFDRSRGGARALRRWPTSAHAYQEKCARVDAALRALAEHRHHWPALIGLGECTQQAAEDLRQRLVPTYRLVSYDVQPEQPYGQMALLLAPARHGWAWREQTPLLVPATSNQTRPMPVLELVGQGWVVRFVFCHWPARFRAAAQVTRQRLADFLSQWVYDYLAHDEAEQRHVVILGDFNEEPFGLLQEVLHGQRQRQRARQRAHPADHHAKRRHLYNCMWRLLGEQRAFDPTQTNAVPEVAGSYYWQAEQRWYTFDQVLVSGGLLTVTPPCLDETHVTLVGLPVFVPDNQPAKFTWQHGRGHGLSDHLPVLLRLLLGNDDADTQ